MYVFVTGSREATPHLHGAFIQSVIAQNCAPHASQLVHGDARGVDRMVAGMFPWYGALAIPANWKVRGNGAGSIRNEALVDIACTLRGLDLPVIWLAFPCGLSSGTRNCIRLAQEARFEVSCFELLVIPSD